MLDSFYEGGPIVTMEALTAGLPVVTSEVGAVVEQVGDDGSRGFVVPNPLGDPVRVDWDDIGRARYRERPNRAALVDAMRAVVDDRATWAARRGQLALESIERFRADVTALPYASLLREVAGYAAGGSCRDAAPRVVAGAGRDARMRRRRHFVHRLGCCESDRVGPRTRIWAFAHVMAGAVVGADCNLCDHTFVESGARLGDRVTLKNGVAVWTAISLEDDVFVGPGTVFTNDHTPRAAPYRTTPDRFLATVVERCHDRRQRHGALWPADRHAHDGRSRRGRRAGRTGARRRRGRPGTGDGVDLRLRRTARGAVHVPVRSSLHARRRRRAHAGAGRCTAGHAPRDLSGRPPGRERGLGRGPAIGSNPSRAAIRVGNRGRADHDAVGHVELGGHGSEQRAE